MAGEDTADAADDHLELLGEHEPASGKWRDIEREVDLSGPLHSKGVLILAGFLGARYARELKARGNQVADQLNGHGGPWLLGSDYSVVDAYSLMLCRWTRNFSAAPARERPHLGPHMRRVLEAHGGNKSAAARQLGVSRKTLERKLGNPVDGPDQ